MVAPQGLEGRFYFFERDIYSLSEAKRLRDEQGYAEAIFTARSLNYGEGTTLFNQFQEVGVHSNWGSFSAQQDLLDNSPRWDALK
ncbi:hypothetical protein [Kiloniella majae]|uniref:hypothetical protein n=1 Tax=Kiloniella majae TaxID=1938558 RepID=UPI000A276EEF|nr:hypothetical protein [Kiloniella majae]